MIKEMIMVARYKISYIHKNTQIEDTMEEKVPFIIATEKIKHLECNRCYQEKYFKLKVIKADLNKMKTSLVLGL